jgi:mitosis inhibitor protein kinase SWE1
MVASYSPHRHHGETATLFSQNSPSQHLLHSPSSCTSPFAIPLSTSVTTRSASRRSSPVKSPVKQQRGTQVSPSAKFPLSITSHSSMNTGGMTLRSGSSSPHSNSPQDKMVPRSSRFSLCSENGSSRPSSGSSPLKRNDGVMSLDEEGRGSPVAKRRSTQLGFYSSSKHQPPIFGSPSLTPAGSLSPTTSSKRNSPVKKSAGHIFEKPSFVRSRPPARQTLDFSRPSNAASRIRRVTSVENFLPPMSRESPFTTRRAPLPNASAHPHVQPHPLSKAVDSASNRAANRLPSGGSSDWMTPQNTYKSAKPNMIAFHSTGFVPKRGRQLDAEKDFHPQPDTPCKRTTAFPGSAFQTKHIGARIPMGELRSPQTPLPGEKGFSLNLPNRRDSLVSEDGDEDDIDDQDHSQSSSEYELPPTPTKKSWGDFDDGSVFSMNKRIRTEENCNV